MRLHQESLCLVFFWSIPGELVWSQDQKRRENFALSEILCPHMKGLMTDNFHLGNNWVGSQTFRLMSKKWVSVIFIECLDILSATTELPVSSLKSVFYSHTTLLPIILNSDTPGPVKWYWEDATVLWFDVWFTVYPLDM